MNKTLELEKVTDITYRYKRYGIKSDGFIKDGYFLELMLLSSIRADGFSNLGYTYSDSYILKMGDCHYNPAFGYVRLSKTLSKIFNVQFGVLRLKENDFKFKTLSLLFNLLYDIGICAENIIAYGFNFFTDITEPVSFTLNRTQFYIRSLKEVVEKVFYEDTVKIKGKFCKLSVDTEKEINEKLERLEELYSGSMMEEYKGNINLYTSLGGDSGILFFRTRDDYIHGECTLQLSYDLKEIVDLGYIRVTVPNFGYSNLLNIEDIIGYEENIQISFGVHNDIRSGFNHILGVLDAWTSLRSNRKSLLGR